MTSEPVIDLRAVDRTMAAAVGGKGANLGELMRIDGVRVPDGFCITTGAFRAAVHGLDDRIRALSRLGPDAIGVASAELRRTVEGVALPDGLAEAVGRELGTGGVWAVRSSATAEDLPDASFAGQQDTYLSITGTDEVLRHVRRCWASLFTERAVLYRLRNGLGDLPVAMGVVVQRMVDPDAAGVLFTADPVSGNRRVSTVDAVRGLGEDLVSGRVNPDAFRVRDDQVLSRTGDALTDEQVVRLARLGRTIEAHFGRPQDIEWCRSGDEFAIVQSRPITTLFPVPEAADDAHRVYLSVGHQQMMTDAMKPLGLSCWRMTALAPMHTAGGRLFVDATGNLSAPASRTALLDMVGRSDPLTTDALRTVLDRGFLPEQRDAAPAAHVAMMRGGEQIATDPGIVTDLIARNEESVAGLRRELAARTGAELFDFLAEAFEEHKRMLTERTSMQAIMAGMEATWWLNDHLAEWLGETNAADTLTLSAPGNVTSEMGLALLDVADAIRPHPQMVALLAEAGDDFLDALPAVAGGVEARNAIESYLDRYGMRCAGEIDISRPRWREEPRTLVPLILDHVRAFAPGAAAERFEDGRRRAAAKEQEILTRLRELPDGAGKAAETQRMIDRVRTFIGYREYPKYGIVARYFLYRQALLAEAGRLVAAGVLASIEDIYWLTFPELDEAVRTGRADAGLIRRRAAEFRLFQALSPPRVLTSEGETLSGAYRRDDVPDGALPGLAVSAGTVEGRARVVLDMAEAALEPGDILVTTCTDPSWTPLFVAVAGLVTEVGGLMTHGAVIAREYGLPAVVGVHRATAEIPDGARIRVHGTEGYVELLS